MEYAASWSGGKDSCFAYWKAVSLGLKVSYLLNFINEDSARAMSHGLDHKLIALQAQAMGLPIIQQRVTWDTYEAGFKAALEELKLKGVTGLVTGDIHLQEHKDWIDRVCGEIGVEAILPLWQMNTSQLLTDFIDAGFKATVVSVKAEFFGEESGELHTFVYDGPPFKKAIEIINSAPVFRDDRWFLDILEYSLG